MYLKYVEMQGFKSFPDKMTFRFGEGITAIVGPNGSGKSNVSDAIRWVLGEISSKSLRGSKMEDVIFSGAQGRSPSSFAEVSLCMDNTDRWLNDDHDEVTVTRHYSRSGNSEYYINKKEVRLKDIHELFMDTGIGRDGYSIIGQGQVAEILSNRSDTRREMIDEAAGISKYKHKKNDTLKNLSNAADDLVRLTDILNEVGSRVEPLRKESEKTEKYLVLYSEAKTLEVSLWMDEIDALVGEKEKIRSAYDAAKEKLEICEKEIADCEALEEAKRAEIRENGIIIEENRSGIRNHEHRMNELSEKKSVLENDLRHYEERLSEIRIKYAELKEKINAKSESFNTEHGKGNELNKRKDELELSVTEGEEKLERLGSAIYNMDFEIGNLALSKELELQQIAEYKNDEISCRTNIEQLKVRINEAESDGGELEAGKAAAEEKMKKLFGDKELTEKELAVLSEEVSNAEERIAILNYKADEDAEKLSSLLIKRAETAKHIDMLTRMENMLEGYSYSVKTVMQAFSAGRLSGIHGPVSKLISAPEKYAVALEVALGAQAQHIVTENEKSTKECIAYLKSTKGGRATFLPMETISGKRISEGEINGKKGYVGIACDLVEYEGKYSNIVNYLLGRTVVAEDIDTAAAIARACAFRYKVVSLDGQVVNAGGSFTGGSLGAKTGMLTRTSDIEKLTRDLQTAEADIEAKKAQIDDLRAQAALLNKKMSESTQKRMVLANSLAGIEAELAALSENAKGELQRRMAKDEGFKKLRDELSSEEAKLLSVKEKLNKCEASQKDADDRYNAKKEEYKKLQSDRDELQNKLYDMKIELAEVTKDIENYLYNIASMAQTLEIESAELTTTERALSEVERKILSVKEDILITKTELDGGNDRYAEMEKTVRQLDAANLECEKIVSECSAKLKKCYSEKENLLREYTRAEAKLENGQTEHDRLIARLFDTYDLTYTTASEFRTVIENKTESSKRLALLKADIKKLGSVNLNAVAEYAEVKERFEFLSVQVGDLVRSKEELEKIIADLDQDMKRILGEAMKSLDENFSRIFKELFGGGKAHIGFADEDDVIDGEIEIIAQPPGKTVNSIQLLSGGERSLISISLYFALIAVSPTPFCIMDEIESALDDVNVDRFAQYARRFCEKTQFIMITHRRGTMNVADILYGITMQEKGISKYLTISVDEVEQRLGIKL